jgi:predicted ribosome quality control (RQC) complex YloA/Tae2 family protein
MLTDWLLIRRLAYELRRALAGSRVRDAGLLPDGRIALALRGRSEQRLLAIDAFAAPPLVTLESGELGIAPEPGFVRALATTLADMTLSGVEARRGDRVLRFTFSARSRFGVGEQIELIVELVPRFGNVVLVKGGTVVAAAKEFSPSENAQRSVQIGFPYEPPPLAAPAVPRTLAEAGVTDAQVTALADDPDAMLAPLHVYRRDGTLERAHLLPLPAGDAEHTREPSLLAIFSELRSQRAGSGSDARDRRTRAALLKRLLARERTLERELAGIAQKRAAAAARDELRAQGEALYASLHERAPEEREAIKDEATALFARYKKLGASLAHLDTREARVRSMLDSIEALRWEVERAPSDDLTDVETAVDALDGRAPQKARSAPRRKRRPLELRTPSGSRIVVGRSPIENADVTFRIGRPHDLWFHVQGVPGAHVILARDDRDAAPEGDVLVAAAAAAYHSKAKESAKVAVDYTLRKHVRKRIDAPPGLVWYTDFQTVIVPPLDLPKEKPPRR